MFKSNRMIKMIVFVWLLAIAMVAVAEVAQMEVIELKHRGAQEIESVVMPLLDPGEVVVAAGSKLIARASPERLVEIKRLIAQLDTQLHNLQITVVQSQNISAAELNAQGSIQILAPIKYTTHRPAQVHGRYYQTQKNAVNQSTQMLNVLEGQTAYIKVGRNRTLQNVTVYDNSYGPAVVVNSTLLLEDTAGFEVIPRLSGDVVALEISPWSDQWQNQGVMSTQSAVTSIRANLGEWVEIGAVRQSGQEQQQSRFAKQTLKADQDLHILVKVDKAAN